MSTVKEIIDKSVQLLLEEAEQDIDAILLFGSHADGTAIWRSDVDVCVVFTKPLSQREAVSFRLKILRELPEKVDLQVFNVLPLKIKRSIAQNHKILFKQESFDEFNFVKRNTVLYNELKHKIALVQAQ